MEEHSSPPVLWLTPESAPPRIDPSLPCIVSGFGSPPEASEPVRALRAAGAQWIALAAPADALDWLRAGAWSVLDPASDRVTAEEAAGCVCNRARRAVEVSPLTGLPGNTSIREFLEAEVVGKDMRAAWVDITDFKPFNDTYGFARGDAVIRLLASCLSGNLPGCLVGHVGGDDFVCAGPEEILLTGIEKAVDEFRSEVPGFYAGRDRTAGGIEALDRFGRFRFIPFLDLSISVVDGRSHSSIEELARCAGRDRKRRRGDPIPAPASEVLRRASGHGGEALARLLCERLESGRFGMPDLKAILEAAGVTGDSGMFGGISAVLAGGLCPGLRKSAALALGSLCGPDSVGILAEAMSDPSPHVRTRAVEALSSALGSGSADLIAKAVEDRSSWVRRAALRALGGVGGEGALASLLAAAEDGAGGRTRRDRDEERKAALDGLARLGSPRASTCLLSMLGRTGEPVRAALWRAVAGCPAPECALALSRALGAEESARAALRSAATRAGEATAILEKASIDIVDRGGEAGLQALLFLSSLAGPCPPALAESLRRTFRSASGPLFTAAVSVARKRGALLSKADVEAVGRVVCARPEIYERDSILAFIDWASRSCRSPGAFLDLVRHEGRDISVAAARAVLRILEEEGTADGGTISSGLPPGSALYRHGVVAKD